MAEAKRYYWIKLKEDFFQDDAISWIEEQKDGKECCLFYLKLCLKSLRNQGVLVRYIGDSLIPYDEKKLAEITSTRLQIVKKSIKLLSEAGLITVMDTGEIQIERFEEMAGNETAKAEYMRRKRMLDRNNDSNDKGTMLPECSTEVLKSLHRDRDRERVIDKELKNSAQSTSKNSAAEPVAITLTLNDKSEYEVTEKLVEELSELYPAVDILQELKKMKGWIMSNPRKRKTRSGILKFINSWLSKEQDKGYSNKGHSDKGSFTGLGG